jgi:nitrate/nitrite transport system ATP-binding protein
MQGVANSVSGSLAYAHQSLLGMAIALAMRPKLLLLDEPFGALDALTRGVIQDELLKICSETQQTVFMITHDVDEAVLLADKIMLMSNGPNARIAEIVINTLPKNRKRASLHHDPMYYPMRNHLVDFLVNRSKDLQAKGSNGGLEGYQPILVCPGLQTPVTQ